MSTVEEYLAKFADSERALLEGALAVIRTTLPDAQERLSYGVIRIDSEGGHPLYIGGWKKHVGIYPVPIAGDELELELAQYRSAKDSLHFAWNKPMPLGLIGRVAAYVAQQKPN